MFKNTNIFWKSVNKERFDRLVSKLEFVFKLPKRFSVDFASD